MDAAKHPIINKDSIKNIILNDLKSYFKTILVKHLDDRAFNENKIKNWADNILLDCKEYFIKKYPDYDLFLQCFICDRNVTYKGTNYSISVIETDGNDSTDFETDNLYSNIDFCFYRHYNLDYSLTDFEADIIKKGNDILFKYLEDRKFNYDKMVNYNKNINEEHNNYIFEKCNTLRSFTINRIFENPIKGKYNFYYLSHGKDIYRAIFQNYQNDSLVCSHDLFFFK